MKHIIGLDFDGVIVDHTKNKIKAAAELGITLSPQDTPSDILKKKVDTETINKLQSIIYDNRAYALTTPLIPGVLEGLAAIRASQMPYFLISRQWDPAVATESIKAHGLWENYFTESNIFFVREKSDKAQKAAELGVTIYIDDQPSVLAELTHIQRVLLDPLGVYEQKESYKKIASWPEFLKILEI